VLLAADGTTARWDASPLPGNPVDAYGAGDCFAAGLTFGLADGRGVEGALELAARCVVETGTASYYTTLSRASPDPVLSLLTRRIVEDEVRHFKYFYRFFRRYQEMEKPRHAAVVPALWRRLRMSGGADSFIVLKHVYGARYPGSRFDPDVYHSLRRDCRKLVRDHFPHEMSVRMLLKPLRLGPRMQRMALPIAVALARRLVP
jgi:hypothetical protein